MVKVSIWETSENLTACWETTKIVHTLLIVLLTSFPDTHLGMRLSFVTWLVVEVLWGLNRTTLHCLVVRQVTGEWIQTSKFENYY